MQRVGGACHPHDRVRDRTHRDDGRLPRDRRRRRGKNRPIRCDPCQRNRPHVLAPVHIDCATVVHLHPAKHLDHHTDRRGVPLGDAGSRGALGSERTFVKVRTRAARATSGRCSSTSRRTSCRSTSSTRPMVSRGRSRLRPDSVVHKAD